MELNHIYNENCLDTMKRMPDNFVDLTVTSPPYDNLRTYNGFTFDFEAIAKELFRVTKTGGVVVWVVKDSVNQGNRSLTSFRQAIYFQDLGFNHYDTIIYNKKTSSLPHINRYLDTFEYMFICSKGLPKTVNLLADRENKWKESWGRKTVRELDGTLSERGKRIAKDFSVRFNVWDYVTGFGNTTNDEIAFNHPAMFPEALARDHILSWSNENDLVYDPFGGSGTTAKAAHQLQRNWILSEISAEYVDLANKRLEPYLMQESLFL